MPTDLHVCRKCKGSKRLVADVEARLARRAADGKPADVAVDLVRCQDICKGAVAGVAVDGQLVWFRRLRGSKQASALAKLAARGGAGPVPRRLEEHRAPRRDGRPVKR